MRIVVVVVDLLSGAIAAWTAWGQRGELGTRPIDPLMVVGFALTAAGALLFLLAGVGLAIRRRIAGRFGEAASGLGVLTGALIIYQAATLEGEGRMFSGLGLFLGLGAMGVFAALWVANRAVGDALQAPSLLDW